MGSGKFPQQTCYLQKLENEKGSWVLGFSYTFLYLITALVIHYIKITVGIFLLFYSIKFPIHVPLPIHHFRHALSLFLIAGTLSLLDHCPLDFQVSQDLFMDTSCLHILFYFNFILLWSDTRTKTTFMKGTFNWELGYSFRGLIHYHHGRKHGSTHGTRAADESYSLVLRLRELYWPWLGLWNLKAHLQWHTSSNKTTTPNHLNPFK